jgi:Ca-activated chloride channel family protein
MPIHFNDPALLLLAMLALPLAWLGWRALRTADRWRRITVTSLRVIVLTLAAAILAGPRLRLEHDQMVVIGVLDVSGSVRRFADLPDVPGLGARPNLEYLRWWFREATGVKAPDDRFGLVVFDGRAAIAAPPTRARHSDDFIDLQPIDGTNVEQALQLALAMFPADAGRRLVLVSDGNETAGDSLAAARRAASLGATPVPIDVLPLSYRVESDVQVARIEAPAVARPEGVVLIRIVLESIRDTDGWLSLRLEDRVIDLNGEEAGSRRFVRAAAGTSVHTARVALGDTPVHRLEAAFESADPRDDPLAENNLARAVIATPGEGRALVIRRGDAPNADAFAQLLRDADIPAEAIDPAAAPIDMLLLQSYDLVVLDNVAAADFDPAFHDALARAVNDLGVGLIMLGGERSFGAGGWNGTPTEAVLPVELDLPKELRLTHAALVLVLDKSGSMGRAVAGRRANQQEVANEAVARAIASLQPDSLVGVVAFDTGAREWVPLAPNENPDATIDAVRSITPGGGTSILRGLRRARDMLEPVDVKRKLVVLLTDGQSESIEQLEPLAREMAADGVMLTTIAIGDDADGSLLARLAEVGGGAFHAVTNPATITRVLVDAVQVINRPLIKEVSFAPLAAPGATAIGAVGAGAPNLEGMVITAPRPDPRVVDELLTPEGEPLLSHWQAGLGRAAAFTSDAFGPWSYRWNGWDDRDTFWRQIARTIARSPSSARFEMTLSFDDGRLSIDVEAADQAGSPLDHVSLPGTVYAPDGRAIDVRLRQVAPGRYAGEADAKATGNYLVALTPRVGDQAAAPVIGGAAAPEGAEFRRSRSNVVLLERLATETGGRVLDVRQPAMADLFDRRGVPPSVSLLPAWRMLLWALLALALLDIASRRLAWDGSTIRAAARAAVSRVSPGRAKGEQAAVTLASLRARSDEVDGRLDRARDDAAGEATAPAPRGGASPAPARSVRAKPIDERESKRRIAAALDEIAGRPAAPKPPGPPAQPAARSESDAPAAPRAEPGEDAPASDTTRDLLGAKRRARERFRDDN